MMARVVKVVATLPLMARDVKVIGTLLPDGRSC